MQSILLFHITIAVSSVLYTTYLFFTPSKVKFYISYALVGLTILSGTYLIVALPAHMLETCTVGLAYIAAVSVAIVAARKKLAHQDAA